MSKPMDVDDTNFDAEALQSDIPVLVDFWAEWCGPCKMIAPIVEELSREYDGRVKFLKVDTDKAQQIPARYGIRGIPTLIVFNKGKVVDQVVGATPKPTLSDLLDKVLAD